MSKLLFFDASLRDGSHAIKHQLTAQNIEDFCRAVDNVGLYTVIVGHGNGLGASSLQVGLSKLTDCEMLTIARRNLSRTKLGVYLIPGFGTIEDNLEEAIEIGVDLFKVGCHCTEADTTKQHIEYLRKQGKETYGILMMYHMASPERLLEEAQKMQSYGANGVIIMDSAGASTPEMVKRGVSTLANGLNIKVGFHAHNNMGLAVANSYTAIQSGATIMDGTIRGFGAGAGNCQLEALVALLLKNEYELDIDFYKMLDASEEVVKAVYPVGGQSATSIVSGMSGVFSAFSEHVKKAAAQFDVDPRDIFIELGKRKAVGGQEDMIVEVAQLLNKNKKNAQFDYQISSLL